MLADGLGILHVWLAGGGEFGGVVAGDAGVVDEELDPIWFFFAEFVVKALDVVLIAAIELGLLVMSSWDWIFNKFYLTSPCKGISLPGPVLYLSSAFWRTSARRLVM